MRTLLSSDVLLENSMASSERNDGPRAEAEPEGPLLAKLHLEDELDDHQPEQTVSPAQEVEGPEVPPPYRAESTILWIGTNRRAVRLH